MHISYVSSYHIGPPNLTHYKLSVHSKHSAWQVLHVLHLTRNLDLRICLQNLWNVWTNPQNIDSLHHLRPALGVLCPTHPWPEEAQVWVRPLWEIILPLLMFLKLHIGSLDIRWEQTNFYVNWFAGGKKFTIAWGRHFLCRPKKYCICMQSGMTTITLKTMAITISINAKNMIDITITNQIDRLKCDWINHNHQSHY